MKAFFFRPRGNDLPQGRFLDVRPTQAASSLRILFLLVGTIGMAGCSRSEAVQASTDSAANAPPTVTASASAKPLGHDPHEKVEVPVVNISDKVETTVHVTWDTPAGTAVNDEAPFRVRWTTSEGLAEVPPEMRAKGKDVSEGFDVRVVATKGAPEAMLTGDVDLVVCDSESHSVCVPVKRKLTMPFLVGHGTTAKRESVKVPLPKAK